MASSSDNMPDPLCNPLLSTGQATSSEENKLNLSAVDLPACQRNLRRGRFLTSLSIILAWTLGLCVALTHYGLFAYLDRKKIDIDTSFPQEWVASLALVFANTFRLLLCFSLGIAITQHLWRIIRVMPMKIADFDRLHFIRNDPRALGHVQTMCGTPILFAMATTGWLITIATIFPPAALTVINTGFNTTGEAIVPVFNGSFVGNGTWPSAQEYMLGAQLNWGYTSTRPSVQAIAKGTLISGEIKASLSPCGSNCTYTVSFDGPSAKCTARNLTEFVNATFLETGYFYAPRYSGGWSTGRKASVQGIGWEAIDPGKGTVQCGDFGCFAQTAVGTFSFSEHTPINSPLPNMNGKNITYARETQQLLCIPQRARYTVRTQYLNAIRSLDITVSDIESLNSSWNIEKPKFIPPSGLPRALRSNVTIPTNLTYSFQVFSIFALIDSLVGPLSGSNPSNYTLIMDPKDPIRTQKWQQADGRIRVTAIKETLISETKFNKMQLEYGPGLQADVSSLDLALTEKKVNEALQNITLNVMNTLNWWNTTTNVTKVTFHTTYSFSSPMRLILPYVMSLVATLPFLVVGLVSLNRNGVPAVDGGFIQYLVTTTGSAELTKAASCGSSMPHDIPTRLKQAECFGKLSQQLHPETKRGVYSILGFTLPATLYHPPVSLLTACSRHGWSESPSSVPVLAEPAKTRDTGYMALRWVSERFLHKFSEHNNFLTEIHRPCLFFGDRAPPSDALNGVLRYTRLMKAVPLFSKVEGYVDIKEADETALDNVSSAIAMAGSSSTGVRFRHHSSGRKVTLEEWPGYMNEVTGETFEVLELPDWVARARKAGIHPLIATYLEGVIEKEELGLFPYLGESA